MNPQYLISIAFVFFSFIAMGQMVNTLHYTVKDGLPSSTVYAATQDKRGFMWIGTEAGLVRFDGVNFKTYTTQDGLPDNEILAVAYDSLTDRLWIISYSKSACYYRNGKFYTSHEDPSLTAIKCEYGEFVNGNIQPGVGMFLYNAFTLYKCTDTITKSVMAGEGILCVKQWSDSVTDIIFVRGVLRYTPSSKKFYKGFGLDSFNAKGKWIGNKLFLYRIGKISVYNHLHNGNYIPLGEIDLKVEKEPTNIVLAGNKYVIGMPGTRAYMIDTSLNDTVRTIWNGSLNNINADHHGNIWIMTSDAGLYVISNNGFVNYNSQNGLFYDNLTCLYPDKAGSIYLGNTHGELFEINRGALAHVKTTYHGNMEKIRAITRKGNKLYVISNYVISYFDLHSGLVKLFPHISGGPKSLLVTDSGNTILVGLLATILKIDTKTDDFKELAFHKRIIDIVQHPDGRIVCASLDGLYFFKSDTLQHIDNPDARLNGRITSLCFTKDSLLWIGTRPMGFWYMTVPGW
ncbi:MAG: putative signal transduction histidine kinase [Bacteroidetes bacterium]|nr:putative signal transduction histidine kinase [Bacteroidota bacterium]